MVNHVRQRRLKIINDLDSMRFRDRIPPMIYALDKLYYYYYYYYQVSRNLRQQFNTWSQRY